MSKIEVNTIETASGSTLTVGKSGDTVTLASGASSSGFKDLQWQAVKTSNFNASAGEGYFVDTSSGAVIVTLPASPTIGDTIALIDYATNFATANLTINVNGNKLEASTSNAIISTNDQSTTLVFTDSTQGWKIFNQDTTSSIQPTYTSATGGTESTSGNFKIHTFNSSSNFVVSSLGNPTGSGDTVDYLVVAGGGGGGGSSGNSSNAGGGAGGLRYSASTYCNPAPAPSAGTALTITAQTYPITVGGGGNGGPNGSQPSPGSQGSTSSFSTISSAGGGGGAGVSGPGAGNAGSGGSGGGAIRSQPSGSGNTPPVSPPQGNSGGTGEGGGPSFGGGGGGGAGAVGSNATSTTGGNGGAGLRVDIPGSSSTFAGGGGGGNCNPGGPASSGGAGGGGNGALKTNAVPSGTANTGGGGGAGGYSQTGGNGGSGIVIIRYKYQN